MKPKYEYGSELSRVEYLTEKLKKFFFVYPEKSGKFTLPNGIVKNKRIDLIVCHKENLNFVFGIEVKKKEYKTGKDLAAWVNQSKVYTETVFEPWGKIPVLIYPAITNNYLSEANDIHPPTHEHNNVNSFLAGIANIGEVQEVRLGDNTFLRFAFNNQGLWREFDFGLDIPDNHNYLQYFDKNKLFRGRYSTIKAQIKNRTKKINGYA